MKGITRRNVVGGAAALVASFPATANATGKPSPAVAEAIRSHRKAQHAFALAIDDFDSADAAYFGFGQDARKAREILVPLAIGGALPVVPEIDMERAKADAIGLLEARHRTARGKADDVLAALSNDLHAETLAALDRALERDREALDAAVNAELAKQEAVGVRAAKDRYDAANDAERDALAELCAIPCRSMADAGAKGVYLSKLAKQLGGAMDWREWNALAISLTGRDGSEAFE